MRQRETVYNGDYNMLNMFRRLFYKQDQQHVHLHLHLDGKIIIENTGESRQPVTYPNLPVSNQSANIDLSKLSDKSQQFVMPQLDKVNEPEVAFGDEVK